MFMLATPFDNWQFCWYSISHVTDPSWCLFPLILLIIGVCMLSCLQLKVQPAASSLYHFTEIILYFLNRFREIFGGADGLTIGITDPTKLPIRYYPHWMGSKSAHRGFTTGRVKTETARVWKLNTNKHLFKCLCNWGNSSLHFMPTCLFWFVHTMTAKLNSWSHRFWMAWPFRSRTEPRLLHLFFSFWARVLRLTSLAASTSPPATTTRVNRKQKKKPCNCKRITTELADTSTIPSSWSF